MGGGVRVLYKGGCGVGERSIRGRGMATHVLQQGAGSRPPSPALSCFSWQELEGAAPGSGCPAGPGLEWGAHPCRTAAAVLGLAAGEGGGGTLVQAQRDRLRGGAPPRTVGTASP
jgi:hypothetical protein